MTPRLSPAFCHSLICQQSWQTIHLSFFSKNPHFFVSSRPSLTATSSRKPFQVLLFFSLIDLLSPPNQVLFLVYPVIFSLIEVAHTFVTLGSLSPQYLPVGTTYPVGD